MTTGRPDDSAALAAEASEPQPPLDWSLAVDPAFKRETGYGDAHFRAGMYFKPMTFQLANTGPFTARRIELIFPAKQQHGEETSWAEIPAKRYVQFTATRRLMTDNAVRVQWFQDEDTRRYWTTLYLPYV